MPNKDRTFNFVITLTEKKLRKVEVTKTGKNVQQSLFLLFLLTFVAKPFKNKLIENGKTPAPSPGAAASAAASTGRGSSRLTRGR